MSIETELFTLLGPAMDGRAYFSAAPDSPQTPYAVFSIITEIEGVTLDENGGADNEHEGRIQIDIYSPSGVEAVAKKNAVIAALKGWHVSNTILMRMSDFEKDTKLHRVTLDISTTH